MTTPECGNEAHFPNFIKKLSDNLRPSHFNREYGKSLMRLYALIQNYVNMIQSFSRQILLFTGFCNRDP
jgi:hypothetical protein